MNEIQDHSLASGIDRLSKVLGVLYVHNLGDVDLGVKAEHLNRCGFSNVEVAQLLGTTSNNINVALFNIRNKGKKNKKRKTNKRRKQKTRQKRSK